MKELSKLVKNKLNEDFNRYNSDIASRRDIDLVNTNNDAYVGDDYGDNSDDEDYKNYLKRRDNILKITDELDRADQLDYRTSKVITLDDFDGEYRRIVKTHPYLLDSEYINNLDDIPWLNAITDLSKKLRRYTIKLCIRCSDNCCIYRKVFGIADLISNFIYAYDVEHMTTSQIKYKYGLYIYNLHDLQNVSITVEKSRNSGNLTDIIMMYNAAVNSGTRTTPYITLNSIDDIKKFCRFMERNIQ